MVLVEREKELDSLRGMLDASMHGRCQVALVSGAVGSGKTELLHTLAEHATDRGVVVLTALGSSAERSVPIGVLSQLFRPTQALPEHAATLSALEEITADVTASRLGAPVGTRTRRDDLVSTPVLDRLCAVFARVAAAHPLLIAIDDVQYADRVSLRCLLHLMRRLRNARVLFVLTESEHEQRRNPLFRVEILRHSGFRRIRLRPLSLSGVELVLAKEVGPNLARRRSAEYHAVSGGNPLLLRALLDDHHMAMSAGAEPCGSGLTVGDSYGQAVLACLHRGNPAMLTVAHALAVLDGCSSQKLLERLLDINAVEAAQALEDLTLAGLVEHGAFRHQAAQAAVLSELSPDQRGTLHRSSARLLHDMGAPAANVARHLLAADHTDDPWVAEILNDAAEQALRDDQAELAVASLVLAARACENEEDRLATTMRLVQAQWRVNPSESCRHLSMLVSSLHSGRLAIRHATSLVRILLLRGRTDDAVGLLEFLGREGAENQEIAADSGLLAQWLHASFPTVLDRVQPPPARGRLLAGLQSLQLRASNLLSALLGGATPDRIIRDAEQVLQVSSLDDGTLESIEAALLALVYADQPGKAASWCEPLLEEAVLRHLPMWSAVLSAVRAEAAIRLGDLPAAERHGTAALSYLTPRNWGVAVGGPMASLVLAKNAMGKHEDAAELLSQPIPKATLDTRYGLHYLYARGQYYIATERTCAALSDFLACGDLMGRWGIDLPSLIPWRSAAAEALLCLGDFDQAKRLAEEQLVTPGGSGGRSRSRGMSLRVLARASEPGERPALLQEAVANLERSGDQLELAHALAESGLAHRALGEPEDSRRLVDQALRLARACKAEPLHETVLSGMTDLSGTVPHQGTSGRVGIAVLSDAELRVATLASLGVTNRQIAEELFITVSTVEQHLTRVYRKLKVGGRADLPSELRPLVEGRRQGDREPTRRCLPV